MKINNEPEKKLNFDPDKCNSLYVELVEVFQKHKPTVGEIIVAISNLCYTLGCSIGKITKGPSFEEAKRLYYSDEKRLDVAFILQGYMISTWYEGWEEVQISNEQDTQEEQPNNEQSTIRDLQRNGR